MSLQRSARVVLLYWYLGACLKNEIEGSWYILRNVSIIGTCFDELSNFSYLIASLCIVWCSSINSRGGADAIEWRNGFTKLNFSSYFPLHPCCLGSQKILPFFFAIVFVAVAVGAAFWICCFVLWFRFLLLLAPLLFLPQGVYMSLFLFQPRCHCHFLLHKQSFYSLG